MKRIFFLGFVALCVSQGAIVQHAAAREAAQAPAAADSGIEDVIVTAQRRKQEVQDVPVAISAFPAARLEAGGIVSALSLVGHVPNMSGSNSPGFGSANTYHVRGLGSSETIATIDPPVGTFVDDILLPRQNGNNFGFFDVERVEVLRGPQGALFGRGAAGGAVAVIMKRPAAQFGGFVEAGLGRFDRRMLRGSVDLPAGEMIRMKLSGYHQDDRGHARNTTTGERINDSDMAGLRLAIQIGTPGNLSWNAAVAYMESNGENIANFECDPRNPADCSGRFVTTGLLASRRPGGVPQYSLPISGRKANIPLGNEVATTLVTSNIEWAGENHVLNLITGVVDMGQSFAMDFADGRGLPDVANPRPAVRGFANGGFSVLNEGSHQQFSQEIRLTGNFAKGFLDYVAGIHLSDESSTTDFADIFTPDTGAPNGLPQLLADRVLANGTTAMAGYLQVDANIARQLSTTFGIRYTDEEKTFSISDNRAGCAVDPNLIGCLNNMIVAPGGAVVPLEQRTRIWTPRLAVSYRPNDDMLLFASATRGFRSGGWNARGARRDALLPFDPEIIWSYEAGMRSAWMEDRLRVNVTGFVTDARSLQVSSAFANPNDGSFTFTTRNVADYRNRGLELEITAQPARGLSLYASLGWQDDRYKVADTLDPDEYGIKTVRQQQADCRAQLAAGRIPLSPGATGAPDCGTGIVTVNADIATPVRTPDWTLALGGSYDRLIPSAGIRIIPSVDILYRPEMETDTAGATIWTGASPPAFNGTVFPANPFGGGFITGSRTAAHFLVNAAVAIRTDDDNWTLSLECENCLDEAYVQSSLLNLGYLGPPRTWLLRARRNF
ncbi:MAG: TonB-dependent receptor [Sandarakinorhabdus sp.]|nr:TonB-dependent receptor [Sandarakinorhabdus sp.]